MINLRPYQTEALKNIKTEFFENNITHQVIRLPTGTGKTIVFSKLPDTMGLGQRRMITLVHREELAQQAANKMAALNPEATVGIEMANNFANDAQLVIASVPTLNKSSKRLSTFVPESVGILTTDECHHAVSPSYQNIFHYFNTKQRNDILNLGVTATINRADGKGLNEIYDKLVYDLSIYRAIKDGWLVDLKGLKIKTSTSLDDVKTFGGDFENEALTKTINTPLRNSLILKSYLEHGEGRKFVAYTSSVEHARVLASVMKEGGLAVNAVWGGDPDRHAKLEAHRNGDLVGIVNCELLTEGYDDPGISCIIMARPTKSTTLYTQMLGRGTRLPAGIDNLNRAISDGVEISKRDCLILDFVDSTSRHSLANLPTLFGLSQEADLKGKPLSQVIEQMEELKEKHPDLNLHYLADLDNIDAFVEQAELFNLQTPPEVIQLSHFSWFRMEDGDYYLPLKDNQFVFLLQDFIGNWEIHGHVKDYTVNKKGYTTLEEVVKEADYQVTILGGKPYKNYATRGLPTDREKPSNILLSYAASLGIKVPPHATRKQVQNAIAKLAVKSSWHNAKSKYAS